MAYRVKTVATLTGLPRGTLLAWERRYDILEPRRSPSGYRIYSDDDVEFLKRLKELIAEGYKISEAVSILKSYHKPNKVVNTEREDGVEIELRIQLQNALLAYDRSSADRILTNMTSLSFHATLDSVYSPILKETGDKWARGEISVAQEHFVSAFCREQILVMFHSLGTGPEAGATVACTTPPDELHDIALLIVAVKLALLGYRVSWLGPSLPVGDLCGYLHRMQPEALFISSLSPINQSFVLEYARQVRACATENTWIVLGGPGATGLEKMSQEQLVFCPSFEQIQQRFHHRLKR